MTFVLSEINHIGVFMASDSSETIESQEGGVTFSEVDKILYFPSLNIGLSTWGDAQIGSQGINEWLESIVTEFENANQSIEFDILRKITSFLADKLNISFDLPKNSSHVLNMGIHIGGFNSLKTPRPGLCHVFINENYNLFVPQLTMIELPENLPSFHLRNGIWEPFAIIWPTIAGTDETFRLIIREFGRGLDTKPKNELDYVALKAEWLGNWVKQMCLQIRFAGFLEYVGKSVKILGLVHGKEGRWFKIPEMEIL